MREDNVMKRFFSALLCVCLLATTISGCSKKENSPIRISTVTNSACAFLSHMFEKNGEDDAFRYELSVTYLPSSSRLELFQNDADVAVIPANIAAQMQKKAAPEVKIIAGISVGGFELLATKAITDLSELKGQKIHIAERDTVMESLLRYLVSLYGLDPFVDITFEYVSDSYTLIEKISNGDVSFALFESEGLYWAKSEVKNLYSYNLTDEFAKKLKNPSIMNYCVVARRDFASNNPKAIEKLLTDVESALNKSTDLKQTLTLAKKHNLIIDDYCGEEFLKSCRADFISGNKMKQKLTAYYKLIYKVKRSLVGDKIPNDDIYYISKK